MLFRFFSQLYYSIKYRTKTYHTEKWNKEKLNKPCLFVVNYNSEETLKVMSNKFAFKRLLFVVDSFKTSGVNNHLKQVLLDDKKLEEKISLFLKRGGFVVVFKKDLPNDLLKNSLSNLTCKIIPIYVNEKEGFPHRTRINIGHRCELSEANKNLGFLKKQLVNYLTYHTYNVFDPYWFWLDLIRFCTVFIINKQWLFFPVKYIYENDKAKKITRKFKGKGLIMANHRSFIEPVMINFSFFRRRVRNVATEEFFENGKFADIMAKKVRTEVYHRQTSNNADLRLVFRLNGILNANGAVVLFPEGHISFSGEILPFQDGLAFLSIMNDAPIYPLVYLKTYKFCKKQYAVIGEPIDLKNYYSKDEHVDKVLINRLTNVLRDKMIELYNFGQKELEKRHEN